MSPLDFPRVVKFKPRTQRKQACIPKALKKGRTHEDFLIYTKENNIREWVEMDTVIGSIGGKAILTFDLTVCNFMFGILLENKTSAEVSRAIKRLKSRLLELGSTFGEIFPLILTDNGGEFADVFSIENTSQGERETRLYFCDPYQSSQKPHVEKNHTLFRDIVPQGSSFDDFTQDTVDLIFSHVNAIKRRRFRGKSPFEHFAFLYDPNIISALGIRSIAECEVCQSPALLKR